MRHHRLTLLVCLLLALAKLGSTLPQNSNGNNNNNNAEIQRHCPSSSTCSSTDSSGSSKMDNDDEVEGDYEQLYDEDNDDDIMSWQAPVAGGDNDKWSSVHGDEDDEDAAVEGPLRDLNINKNAELDAEDLEQIDNYFHDSMVRVIEMAQDIISMTQEYMATSDPLEKQQIEQDLERMKPKFVTGLEVSDLLTMNDFYRDFAWLKDPQATINNLQLTIELMNMLMQDSLTDDDDFSGDE